MSYLADSAVEAEPKKENLCFRLCGCLGRMGSGEDAQFVFAKYDYTAQGNQVNTHNFVPGIFSRSFCI